MKDKNESHGVWRYNWWGDRVPKSELPKDIAEELDSLYDVKIKG